MTRIAVISDTHDFVPPGLPARLAAADEIWHLGDVCEPETLAVFEAPCVFRQPGLQALDDAGVRWRVAFTSPSLTGLWAAVEAGLGVTVRTHLGVPPALEVLGAATGLPDLPDAELSLYVADAEMPQAAARLRDILLDELSMGLAPLVVEAVLGFRMPPQYQIHARSPRTHRGTFTRTGDCA